MPPGALSMLILRVLQSSSLHGYAIVQRIQVLSLKSSPLKRDCSIPHFRKSSSKGWVTAEWGISETNRKVRFYRLTPAGRTQLKAELAGYDRVIRPSRTFCAPLRRFPMGELWRRILYLFNRRRFEAELEADMEFHREMAANAGRNNFGNTLRMREQSREAWGWTWLDRLLQDLRYGARILARAPGFTFMAVLVLAIGIGVNVSAFSLFQHGRAQTASSPRSRSPRSPRAPLTGRLCQRDGLPIIPLLSAACEDTVCGNGGARRSSHANRRRQPAQQRLFRHAQLLHAAGYHRSLRSSLPALARRLTSLSAGHHPQLRTLAAPFRRRSLHHRPHHSHQ